MFFCRVSVLEKEDWKHIVDIVTNAKLVVSSIQDVARKLADYAKIVTVSTSSGKPLAFLIILQVTIIYLFQSSVSAKVEN
jgi:hypothetical protein